MRRGLRAPSARVTEDTVQVAPFAGPGGAIELADLPYGDIIVRHHMSGFKATQRRDRPRWRRHTGEPTVESDDRIESERCLASGTCQLVSDVRSG